VETHGTLYRSHWHAVFFSLAVAWPLISSLGAAPCCLPAVRLCPGPGPGLDLCLLIDRSVVESFVDHDRTVQTRVTIGRNAGPWAMLLSDPDRPVMVAATSITWVPAADAPAL